MPSLKAKTNAELLSYIMNIEPMLREEIGLPVQGQDIAPIGKVIVNNENCENTLIGYNEKDFNRLNNFLINPLNNHILANTNFIGLYPFYSQQKLLNYLSRPFSWTLSCRIQDHIQP